MIGEVIALFDGRWMYLDEGMLLARVIVACRRAVLGKPMILLTVIGEWIDKLFVTTLDANSFLAEDVLDLSHGSGVDRGRCLASQDFEVDLNR